MKSKKILSILVAFSMIVSLLPSVALATSFSDMPNDYSTTALKAAVENGLLQGHEGKLNPRDSLTRAQMASIIVRAFGAVNSASLANFTDVSPDAWYAKDLAKAVQMGAFHGDNGYLYPDQFITREEAFVVIARTLNLTSESTDVLEQFKDKSDVSDWASHELSAMLKAGYIHGDSGVLNAKGLITRADFAVAMNNIFKTYLSKSDTYTSVKDGTVIINTAGVTLRNLTVNGDLIIADGADDGTLTLDQVEVTGRILVRGGKTLLATGACRLNGIWISSSTEALSFKAEGDKSTIKEMFVDTNNVNVTSEKVEFSVKVASGITGTMVNGKAVAGGSTFSIVKPEEPPVPGGGSSGGGSVNPPLVNKYIREVKTSAAFSDAVADPMITTIKLTSDIIGDISAIRNNTTNLVVEFGTYKLNGNLTFLANEMTSLTFNGTAKPAISGNLTLTMPKASVTNNVAVGGTAILNAVAFNSYHGNNTHGALIMQGPGRLDLSGAASTVPVTISTADPVTLAGTIGAVTVATAGAQTTVAGSVSSMNIPVGSEGSSLILSSGTLSSLNLAARNSTATLSSGTLQNITLAPSASNSNLNIGAGINISGTLLIEAPYTTTLASGQLQTLSVSSNAIGARLALTPQSNIAQPISLSAPNAYLNIAGTANGLTVLPSAVSGTLTVQGTASLTSVNIQAANTLASITPASAHPTNVTIGSSALNTVIEAPGNTSMVVAASAPVTVRAANPSTITPAPDNTASVTTIPTLTVTFDAAGGIASAPAKMVVSGETIGNLPMVQKTGYTFDGWFTSATGGTKVNTSDVISTNVTYFAHWTGTTYPISYILNGGQNASSNPATYTIGNAVTLSAPTGKTGYTFDGWLDNGKKITAIPLGSSGEKTLTALWKINTYIVTFNANGGSSVSPLAVDYANSLSTSFPSNPTKAENYFAGWYLDTAFTLPFNNSSKITGNTTVYAKWIANSKCVVNFVTNGGNAIKPFEAALSSKITKPADPAKVGYTFAGWFRDVACNFAWDFVKDTIPGNMDLYAKWIINKYTITFDSKGGNSIPTINDVNYSSILGNSLITPTRANYRFEGWFADTNYTQPFFSSTPITVNMTLTAKWSPIEVTGVAISSAQDATNITTSGGTLQMSAVISPSDALAKDVVWSVKGLTGKASISASGLLTAEENGTVLVRAENSASGVYQEKIITISNQNPIIVTAENFNTNYDTVYNGVSVGWHMSGSVSRIASVKVELFHDNQLLVTNSSKSAALFQKEGAFSSPFVVRFGSYTGDEYWNLADWKPSVDPLDKPNKAVITITDTWGNIYQAVNSNFVEPVTPWDALVGNLTVTTPEQLSAALVAAWPGDVIKVAGILGSEAAPVSYNVTKPVTIVGEKDNVIHGAINLLTDGVTLNELNIYSRGGGSDPMKNGVNVVAKSATITGCKFFLNQANPDKIGNAIVIYPTDAVVNYTISGNTIQAYKLTTGGWGSSGIAVTEGYDYAARFGLPSGKSVASCNVNDEAIALGNTFVDCSNEYVHIDWTKGGYGNYKFGYFMDDYSDQFASSTGTATMLLSGTVNMDQSTAYPANVTIRLLDNANVNVTGGSTVTLNGNLELGTGSVFAVAADSLLWSKGTISGAGKLTVAGFLQNAGTITSAVDYAAAAPMLLDGIPTYNTEAVFSVDPASVGSITASAPYDVNRYTYTCKLTGTLKLSELRTNLKPGANPAYTTDFIHVLIPIPTGATHIQYSDGLVNPSQNMALVLDGDINSDCRMVTRNGVNYLELNMQYVLGNPEKTQLSMNGDGTTKIGKVYINFNNGTDAIQQVYYKFDCTGLTFDNTVPAVTVTTPEQLSAALVAAWPGDIIKVAGILGSEAAYTIYDVRKPVNIIGEVGNAVYGTFQTYVDGVTYDSLNVFNQGGIHPHKNAINLFGSQITVKNCVFTMGHSLPAGQVANGLVIWPMNSSVPASLVLSGNTFNGYQAASNDWSSSGVIISENCDVTATPSDATDHSATISIDDQALKALYVSNTFTACYNDFVKSDWAESGKYSFVGVSSEVGLPDALGYAKASGVYVVLGKGIALTAPWTTQCPSPASFKGILDGNGKSISGLTAPLLDVAENATFKNLLINVNISGLNNVGSIANQALGGLFEGVTVSGTISAIHEAGGLVWTGRADATHPNLVFRSCTNIATIRISADPGTSPTGIKTAGGLVAQIGSSVESTTQNSASFIFENCNNQGAIILEGVGNGFTWAGHIFGNTFFNNDLTGPFYSMAIMNCNAAVGATLSVMGAPTGCYAYFDGNVNMVDNDSVKEGALHLGRIQSNITLFYNGLFSPSGDQFVSAP